MQFFLRTKSRIRQGPSVHTETMFLKLILLKQSPFKIHFPIENFLCFVCHGNLCLRALIWKKGMYILNVRTSLTKYQIPNWKPVAQLKTFSNKWFAKFILVNILWLSSSVALRNGTKLFLFWKIKIPELKWF